MTNIRIKIDKDDSRLMNLVSLFEVALKDHFQVGLELIDQDPFDVLLKIQSGIGDEGYTISSEEPGPVCIAGNDLRGLTYGVGKFLRTSRVDGGHFSPSQWASSLKPSCSFRGIYLATHFNNYYISAPITEVQQYLGDLLLWGYNVLGVTFPCEEFDGIDTPRAQKHIRRLKVILQSAKEIGFDVCILKAINIGFKTAPKHVLAPPHPDDMKRRGYYGVRICPSHEEGRTYLLRLWEEFWDEFSDVNIDYVEFWPYDEGGCGCEQCWPWGYRGFLDLSRDAFHTAKQRLPDIKCILSTWMFDTPEAGEWAGLSKALSSDRERWVDYIMADSHEDFPRYPLEHDIKDEIGPSLLNFPEISMWGQSPWGGYGANPLPQRFQRLWEQVRDRVDGGLPYSEGIFEDMNKILFSQWFWNPKRTADDILTEYIEYEFSPSVVDEMLECIHLLEAGHERKNISGMSIQAFDLLQQVERKLPQNIKKGWRWRILYLRGLIDKELFLHKGKRRGKVLGRCFKELVEIYHAQEARGSVKPSKAKRF
ncbi:MAG: hypothetical protein ACFFCS_16755 [Candidatus Hodarchaeota archaeon]